VASPSPIREDEAREVFAQVAGVIRAALLTYYRLTPEETAGAEEDLLAWFLRLTRRGGSSQMPIKALRLALLSAACQYGRSLQVWKLGDAPADERLSGVLSRDPEELASDLHSRLDEER